MNKFHHYYIIIIIIIIRCADAADFHSFIVHIASFDIIGHGGGGAVAADENDDDA